MIWWLYMLDTTFLSNFLYIIKKSKLIYLWAKISLCINLAKFTYGSFFLKWFLIFFHLQVFMKKFF